MSDLPSDPAAHLAALEAASLRIETPCDDGVMVWRSWGAGQPLILLHGGFGAWNHWVRNIPVLSQHYEVIAADLPGLGDSDTLPRPYDARDFAVVLRDGLEEILATRGPCHIVCFSFGAAVGAPAAAMLGDLVASFTSAGGAGFGPREHVIEGLKMVRPTMDAAEQRETIIGNLAGLMFAHRDNIDELAIHIHATNTQRTRTRSRPISLTDSQLQALPQIHGRVNAIWGSLDITAQGILQDRIDAIHELRPDARIELLDGIGHWVQYEGADLFNTTLLEVLAG